MRSATRLAPARAGQHHGLDQAERTTSRGIGLRTLDAGRHAANAGWVDDDVGPFVLRGVNVLGCGGRDGRSVAWHSGPRPVGWLHSRGSRTINCVRGTERQQRSLHRGQTTAHREKEISRRSLQSETITTFAAQRPSQHLRPMKTPAQSSATPEQEIRKRSLYPQVRKLLTQ